MKPMAPPPTPGAPVALEPELGPEALPDETLLEQAAPSRATTALSAHTTLRALMSLSPLGWWSSSAGFVRPAAQRPLKALSDRCVRQRADQSLRGGVEPLAGEDHEHQDRDDVGQGVESELVQGVAPGLQRRREGEGRAEEVGP